MSTDTYARQLLVFTLGTGEYALPIESVQEVTHYREPRSVASPIACVRGVISRRGSIIPVYDLAERLRQASRLTERTRIMIVESVEGPAGVIVDDVSGVLTVAESALEPVPGADCDLIDGVATLDERLVVLIDTTAIAVTALAA